MNKFLIIALLGGLFFQACQQKEEEQQTTTEVAALFTKMSADQTGVTFTNTVENQKDFNIFKYRNFYNGGGVALGDINNDGLADIYLTANMGPNKLFLNQGDFKFKDISAAAGVEGNKPWSTGVNMVDVNQDGLLDIYVSNAGNMEGDNHDNDLYINNGDLTFTEKAEAFNLAETGFSTHATFFDYDKDGDLDAYILNNSNIPVTSLGTKQQRDVRAQDWDVPKMFRGVGDMLLRNDGDTFTEVSEESGIYGSLIGFGLGVMVTDINNDLWPDIYVSNDFYERDYLYINNQDGTFTEDIKNWMSHLCLSAMGIDMADINNDGNADIFITDMLPDGDQRVKSVMEFEGYNVFKLKQSKDFYQQYIQNTLQLNNGNGSFSEIAYYSGVSATDWSWSGLMFDMDNDGFRDIFVTNGVNHDLTDLDFVDFFANEIIQNMALTGKKEAIDSIIAKMPVVPVPNYAYHNNKDLTFANQAPDWGLGEPSLSNGAAYADLDNDGDLDLVVNNVNMEFFLYRNNSETLGNNYVKLRFEGPESNKFAVGTRVRMYYDGNEVLQELVPSRGFQSSMEHPMTVGLGKADKIDSLRVIWPNDLTELRTDLTVNTVYEFDIKAASEKFKPQDFKPEKTLIEEISNTGVAAHQENNYEDFDYEGMIYKKISQEGPALAVADIDADGNQDVFIGGAKDQAGMIYIHKGKGQLLAEGQTVFQQDAELEDTAAAFFDVDGDSDLDLMVGSGGNQVNENTSVTARLYLNDGNGNFEKAEMSLPPGTTNISVIAPYDYDQDGDMDVFLGARSVIGIYGIDPQSLFLENKGAGQFEVVTDKVAKALQTQSGMITDASWVDLVGDQTKELLTVSDWGAPVVYELKDGVLTSVTTDLEMQTGWWNTAEAADLDGDGDLDLVLGNQGENIHYRPTSEQPMKIWVSDFDNNGTIEQLVTQQLNGRDMPIHQKKEIVGQMVSLKKQNLKASEYAKRSIQELFTPAVLGRALVKEVVTSKNTIAINLGNGKFRFQELPARAQLSCICGIACTDLNNDGTLDLLLGGNNYEFKPQYSRLDANYGSVLLNDGSGNFAWQDYGESGYFVKDEIKHMQIFTDADGNQFMITAINDQQPKIHRLNE